jgi:hypothetical protein
MRIILVTKTGCGPCGQFLARSWPALKDKLSYGIGGKAIEHIDIADGFAKVPPAVRAVLEYVPQIFALYEDGSIDTPKKSITSPEGVAELEKWAKFGPPHYQPEEVEDTYVDDSTYEVVVVTQTDCHHCKIWEQSGDLERFMNSIPPGVEKSQFIVAHAPPASAEEATRRMALIGIGTPAVIVVKHSKWAHPVSQNLQQSDIWRSPGEVRTPDGQALFKRWIKLVADQNISFIGYMILATSSSCGYCVKWKESGGMDSFIAAYGSIPGILLSHNGVLPPAVRAAMPPEVPAVFFVAAQDWGNPNPEIAPGPDPRNDSAMKAWVAGLTSEEGTWTNVGEFVPADYQAAATMRAPKPMAAQVAKRPLQRQKLRV